MDSSLQTPEPIQDLLTWVEAIRWYEVAYSIGVLGLAVILGWLAVPVVLRLLRSGTRRTRTHLDDKLMEHLRQPLRWLFPAVILRAAVPLTLAGDDAASSLRHLLLIAIIFAVAWALYRVFQAVEDVLAEHYSLEGQDNLKARQVVTQVQGLRNIGGFLIGVIAIALALTTFERVRQFGVTLLASAGVAGIVIGFAAQRSISTIIAGIQIALTQPIRVDDVVIVEGEWGRIEEITLTYVVVKIWDLRRLVVPINYFIENSFQNWTRTDAELLGTVFLETDYTVSVEVLRAELDRILEDHPKWDGKAKGMVVTDAKERTMQVRALMSAANSGDAWELRCDVREKLIAFLQENYPESLPRLRAEVAHPDRQDPAGTQPAA